MCVYVYDYDYYVAPDSMTTLSRSSLSYHRVLQAETGLILGSLDLASVNSCLMKVAAKETLSPAVTEQCDKAITKLAEQVICIYFCVYIYLYVYNTYTISSPYFIDQQSLDTHI